MEYNNDFLGSIAQENVQFATQIVKTASVGENYWKVMIFVGNEQFITADDVAWIAIPGSTKGAKALVVTADNYAEHTTGKLNSWLVDLFSTGFLGDCILVNCGITFDDLDTASFTEAMNEAYSLMKAYAYHKTICLDGTDTEIKDVVVEFAKLCAQDKGLLSSAPYLPFYISDTVTDYADVENCVLYKALMDANTDAFMTCYMDNTRNASLYSLGLALSYYNGSGTQVGNTFDMYASGMIKASGPSGTDIGKSIRDYLKGENIPTFKYVGDNTGNVAAIGDKSIQGDIISATWIISYITYMTKVGVARLMTSTPNFLKTEDNYGKIVTVMQNYLSLFGPTGSGRLGDLLITAPVFAALPPAAGDEIIIPNAWSARYIDHVRNVKITGTLYIGV